MSRVAKTAGPVRPRGKWKTQDGYSTGSPVARDAIGIFDSGVGGLTVMHELVALLPAESFVYLGDTGRYPYGDKSPETVTRYSLENAAFLIEKGIKLLVVACNAASSVALDALRAECRVPVVGVIEPGAKAAVASTSNGRVGVIGTEVTIASGAYTRALKRLRPQLEIYTRACPLFVPLAEEGWTDNEVTHATIALYLGSLRKSGIDALILGCTHYPLLKDAIAGFLGAGSATSGFGRRDCPGGSRDAQGERRAPPARARRGELLRHGRSGPVHQGRPPLPRRARRVGGANRAMSETGQGAAASAAGAAEWLTLLRPDQWVKNLLVFAALIFSKHLLLADSVVLAALAFVSFCCVASASYLMNDVQDAESDRLHPGKRLRPIAAGRVTPATALLVAALLAGGGLAIGLGLGPHFALTIVAYAVLQISYSFVLKDVVIIDVMAIADGLRVAGRRRRRRDRRRRFAVAHDLHVPARVCSSASASGATSCSCSRETPSRIVARCANTARISSIK